MGPGRCGITYRLGHPLCRWLAVLYCRHEWDGVENIPPRGGFLLSANHRSLLDPVLVASVIPRPIHFVARRTLFRSRFFGGLIQRLNAIPVDRGRITRGSYREFIELVTAGEGVLLFPEGTRGAGGELGELRRGIIHMARATCAPVVPAYVGGSDRALGRGCIIPRPAKTRVRFGEPLRFESDSDDAEELRRLREAMLALEARETNGRELAPAG